MISRKGLSGRSLLYAILDNQCLERRDIPKVAESVLSAGADLVQLRAKGSGFNEALSVAKEIRAIAKRYNAPFIMNDRVDIALCADADGLHIGQGDVDISLARKILGKDKLIGVSVDNIKQALKARRDGASYVAVGPIFRTPIKGSSKPRGFGLLNMLKKLGVPVFAIGGINRANLRQLVRRGFTNIAVIRALCKARDPYISAQKLKRGITTR